MKKLTGSIAIFTVLAIAWALQPLQSQCMAADPERISIEQLKDLLDNEADVVVVDTRAERFYEDGHIPGAVSMDYPGGIRSKGDELPRDKTIIFY